MWLTNLPGIAFLLLTIGMVGSKHLVGKDLPVVDIDVAIDIESGYLHMVDIDVAVASHNMSMVDIDVGVKVDAAGEICSNEGGL